MHHAEDGDGAGGSADAPLPDRERVLATLVEHAGELRRRGVLHVALFGSVARGDATGDSDIDILVDVDPEAHIGVFGYVAIRRYLEDLFSARVDLANRRALKEAVRPSVLRDALRAF